MVPQTTLSNKVLNFLNKVDHDVVKSTIGDSTNNNRVLTVSQLIRYLNTRRNPSHKTLGTQLEAVYDVLKPRVRVLRRLNGSSRTDSNDVNEFVTFLTRFYGA